MRRLALLLILPLLVGACATAQPSGTGTFRQPLDFERQRVGEAIAPALGAAGLAPSATCPLILSILDERSIQAGVMVQKGQGLGACHRKIHLMISDGALLSLSPAELRGLLAHEMGHVVLDHGESAGARATAEQRVQGVHQVIGAAACNMPDTIAAVVCLTSVMLSGATELVSKGFNRVQEREADRWAVEALLRIEDPQACLGLAETFEKMAQQPGQGLALFSTHPAAEDRAKEVRAACAAPATAARP